MIGPRRSLELCAVAVACSAALYLAAIPSFGGCCRLNANESAAIATLKNLASAQEQALRDVRFDRDCDGVPEHLGLAEAVAFGLISSSFARIDADGSVERSSYRFALCLPSPGGGFVRADLPGARIDPVRAAREWRAYAWPAAWTEGTTPIPLARFFGARAVAATKHVYFVDQSGDVRASPNADRRYDGDRAPDADAAARPDRGDWIVVN